MRKLFAGIAAVLSLFILTVLPLSASAAESTNIIYSIDIDIVLEDNGTAQVTEVWDVDAHQGTEIYIVKDNMEDTNMSVSNLAVSDDTGTAYELVEKWKTGSSFKKKAYKCGYHKDGTATELCFGISQYGRRTYTISYTVKNFVVRYNDGKCGFYQQVVSPGISPTPNHASVIIRKPGVSFTEENTEINNYSGIYEDVYFLDGNINAQLVNRSYGEAHINIFAGFSDGMFDPEYTVSEKSFEDMRSYSISRIVSEQMKEFRADSGYEEDTSDYTGFILQMIYAVGVGIVAWAIPFIAWKKTAPPRIKKSKLPDIEYSRELPFKGDIMATEYLLAKMNRKCSNIIGAYMLRWNKERYINFKTRTNISAFGTEKNETVIESLNSNGPINPFEREMYDIMAEAAGADKVLQEKEFYKWSRKNYSRIETWYKKVKKEGAARLVSMGVLAKQGGVFSSKYEITPHGYEMIAKMKAFEKYLKDFTIINERMPAEVSLWDDYLVFASLFGIADKVAKELEDLYPGYFEEKYNGGYVGYRSIVLMSNAMSRQMIRGMNSARSNRGASLGSGGFSGGGFSGGGFGGGFR